MRFGLVLKQKQRADQFPKTFQVDLFWKTSNHYTIEGGSIVRSKVLHALKRAERTDRPCCGHGSMSVNRGV